MHSDQQHLPIVEYVLKNAPCEVLVLSQGQAALTSQRASEVEENSVAIG